MQLIFSNISLSLQDTVQTIRSNRFGIRDHLESPTASIRHRRPDGMRVSYAAGDAHFSEVLLDGRGRPARAINGVTPGENANERELLTGWANGRTRKPSSLSGL